MDCLLERLDRILSNPAVSKAVCDEDKEEELVSVVGELGQAIRIQDSSSSMMTFLI